MHGACMLQTTSGSKKPERWILLGKFKIMKEQPLLAACDSSICEAKPPGEYKSKIELMRAFNQCWVLRGCGSAFCWDFRAVEAEGKMWWLFRKESRYFVFFWLLFCIILYMFVFVTQEVFILPGSLSKRSLYHRISWVGKAPRDSKIRLKKK